jgi:multicomponent Na+:H+ antiporter subunit D
MLTLGALDAGDVVVVSVLMLSSLLSVGYLLPIVARGYFLPPPPGALIGRKETLEEAPIACLIALCGTAVLCIVLFFQADRIEALLAGLSTRL